MSGMRGWWREGGLRFGEREEPALDAPNDVRVEVRLCGICRTDVAVAQGRIPCVEPRVLGHELVGVVTALGPQVHHLEVGDRVAAHPVVDGLRVGVDRDGGFAEQVVLPEHGLARVPEAMDWRHAAFVEPVAACLAITKAPLEGRVRVVGRGRLATLTRRIVAHLGHTLVATGECDVAIETAGTSGHLAEAVGAVRPGGLVVLKARPAVSPVLDLGPMISREIRMQGVGWASFADAFALLESGLEVDDLLGEVHPLEALGDLLGAGEERKLFVGTEPCAGSSRP